MTENFPQRMLRRVLVVGDPEEPREFRFEMAECAQTGPRLVDVIQSSRQEIMKFIIRMFRFHCGFKELAAVSGKKGGGILFAQPLPPMVDGNLPKRVKVTPAGSDKVDLAAEKQVEFPRKGALGTERALRGGLDQPVIGGEPMNDQAAIREAGQAGQNRRHRITLNLSGEEMKPKSTILFGAREETFLLLMRLSRNKKGA